MEKNKLRKVGLTALEWLKQHPEIKQHKESSLYEQLFASQQWQQAQTIGMIRSLPLELSTQPIFERAMQEGKQVAVPRTFKGGKMHFYQVFPETVYDTSAFGVEEPPLTAAEITATAIDLLIVPGIVFNRAGYRIGFGGGFMIVIWNIFRAM